MAERSPIIVCEDVPLNQARRMSRDPGWTRALSRTQGADRIVGQHAIRLTLPEGTHPPR